MPTYTMIMSNGETYTLSPDVKSPREGEDLLHAVTDTLGLGYWLDRINPICWQVRDSARNGVHGTIVRDNATYYPRVFGDWELTAKAYGDTLTLTLTMVPGRAYWEAPSAAELRAMARKIAREFRRELTPRLRVEWDDFSHGFHARYSLR
jgi:hypothetical protein